MSTIVDFESPPLNEVICGLNFRKLERFTAPYLGLLWQDFMAQYPKCEVHPPLVQDPELAPGVKWEISSIPPFPRVWFVSEDSTRLIQVQQDLIIHNWRQVEPSAIYPRYKTVKDEFDCAVRKFNKFITAHDLGYIEPRYYELSYVNLIAEGEGYESPGTLGELLPDFAWRQSENRFLPDPSSMNYQTVFELPDGNGKLRVSIQDAFRKSDEKRLIRILIVARGMPQSKSVATPEEWFELAHEWVVNTFVDLTGETIQARYWRKR